jgi:hypothetical protein
MDNKMELPIKLLCNKISGIVAAYPGQAHLSKGGFQPHSFSRWASN